jgi:hypothetical protein
VVDAGKVRPIAMLYKIAGLLSHIKAEILVKHMKYIYIISGTRKKTDDCHIKEKAQEHCDLAPFLI